MRGEILDISGDGTGLVSGDDGQRYGFAARDVAGFVPYRGDRIDFVPAEGMATDIVLLSSGPTPTSKTFRTNADDGQSTPWGYFMRCMRKYIDGHGRARRSEYWWFMLFRAALVGAAVIVGALLTALGGGEGPLLLSGQLLAGLGALAFIGTIIPNFCAMIRRFHDVGLSGWLVLLNAIPYVGPLITLVITVLPTQEHPNAHGPVPLRGPDTSKADIFT